MTKSQNSKERRREVAQAIEHTKALKKQLKETHARLERHYKEGTLSYTEFKAIEKETLKGRTLTEWLNYYDDCIEHYRQQSAHHEEKIQKTQGRNYTPLIASILLIAFILFATISSFTGFNIVDMLSGNTSESFLGNETNITNENILTSGTTIEEGTSIEPEINETENIPKEENLTENIIIEPAINETISNETIIEIPETILNETIVNDSKEPVQENASIIPINETISESYTILSEQTTQAQARIGKPVVWTKRIELDTETKKLEIEIPSEGDLVHVREIVNEQEYDIDNSFITINESGVLRESEEENVLTGQVTSEIQESPLKTWLKEILNFFKSLGKTFTGLTIGENPEDTTIIIIEEPVQEIIIEYTTAAPSLREENTSEGKILTVESTIPYENIETYTTIPETALENIELYKLNNETKVKINFTATDTNADGYIDVIEWISTHSGDSYEIILITDAEHLDSNRTHISNIYEQVKERDKNWSEPIYNDEYVRVRFEQNLTAENDITIYVRNTEQTNTTIEVYAFNSTEKITEFPVIAEEQYYKILLTEMTTSHDVFDLRIRNNNNEATTFLEFDHIIDPTITAQTGGRSSGGADLAIASLSNTSFVLVYANISAANSTTGTLQFQVLNTSGAVIKTTTNVQSLIKPNQTRIAVATINSSTFFLAWSNSSVAGAVSERRAIFNTSGVQLLAPATTDGAIGSTTDIGLARFPGTTTVEYCYGDLGEGDSDSATYNIETAALVTGDGTVPDGTNNAAANQGDDNYIDCAAVDNSTAIYAWYEATSNDIIYSLMSVGNAEVVADKIIDSNVGALAQVAVKGLGRSRAVIAWYDATDQDITFAIRNITSASAVNVSGNTDIDVDAAAGTKSRIALAKLTNGTTTNYFAIAWYSQASNNIQAAIYDDSGNKATAAFVVGTDPNTNDTMKLMAAVGEDVHTNTSLCQGGWALAYTNSSNATVVKTLLINGSTWGGTCPAINYAPNIDSIFANTSDSNNYTNGTINLSLAISDPNSNDIISYQIDWYVNDILNMTFANHTSISEANTTKGENYTAIVAIRDQEFNGKNATATVIINNFIPTVPNIHLPLNASILAYVTTMTVNVSNITDIDPRDNITYIWQYDVNPDFTGPVGSSVAETANVTNIIFSPLGNRIYFHVNASDGTNTSQFSETRIYFTGVVAPRITNLTVNATTVALGKSICINASILSPIAPYDPVSSAWTPIINATGDRANYTLTDTGPWCAGDANDNTSATELYLTETGSWIINGTWANGTVNQLRNNASNITITVTGNDVPPTVTHVSFNDTRSIVEGGIRYIEFSAIVNDTNGDINASSVSANITLAGEALRSNSTCLRVTDDSTGANFTCTIGIEFYDAAGSWQVSVQAFDNATNAAQNNTRYFTLQETTSMNISSASLSFANAGPGARNLTAGPITVQNTGNKQYLNFTIKGIDLVGDTSSGTMIPAANFTVANVTGGTHPAYNECTSNSIIGVSLVNNTAVNIEGANASRGALAQNNLYFCLTHVPLGLTTQIYSTGGTPNEEDWTIAAV